MTETCHPAKCNHDPPRHDTVRDWIVDALCMATAALAVVHYPPDGMLATIIVFVGAYAVANFLWRVVWAGCGVWLCWLSVLILVVTLCQAFATLPLLAAVLLTLFLPGIAQAYLIFALWPATAALSHPLTALCLVWLILLAVWMYEERPLATWHRRWWG